MTDTAARAVIRNQVREVAAQISRRMGAAA
jgi:hypothetical protein